MVRKGWFVPQVRALAEKDIAIVTKKVLSVDKRASSRCSVNVCKLNFVGHKVLRDIYDGEILPNP